jgi:Tfp pilus assembly protein PilN
VSEPTQTAPEPESVPLPDVLVLPAEYFFIEKVEVPTALAPAELTDFAELSMEAVSPFPLDQLRWGFLIAPDGQHLLIYAALKERLKLAGQTELETYTWVLPDFTTLQGARFTQDTEIVLEGEHYTTSFLLPSGETLPENIRSLPAGSDTPHSKGQSIHLKLLTVELSEEGIPTFKFETIGDSPADGLWSPLEPEETSLWNADIRPSSFKTVERSTRRTTSLVTRIMGYAAIFAIVLVVLEGLLFLGDFWLDTRTAKIDEQATSVRRIEDKQSLLNKLDQVAQNELRPIAMLTAANEVRTALGKTGIEYDETIIESNNRLTIEGKANTINELNLYTESLRQSGKFQLAEDPKYITRDGKTTFTVTLDYTYHESEAAVTKGAMTP